MTQGFTQKYTIIQLLEDVPEGTEFSSADWPLHTTLVDTFAIDWPVSVLEKKLTERLGTCRPAESIALDDEFFGPEKQTQVVLLKKTASLTTLHENLIKFLDEGGLKLNDPQFALSGFLPHATVQKHTRIHKGQKLLFNALALIDMFPENDPYMRKILKIITMG